MIVKYVKLRVSQERHDFILWDKLVFTVKRRTKNKDDNLVFVKLPDLFLQILLDVLLSFDFYIPVHSVSDKDNNCKEIVLFLSHKRDEFGESPWSVFWDNYDALEVRVDEELGVKIWKKK